MKRAFLVLGLVFVVILPAWPQTQTQTSKTRQILRLYEKFLSVDSRVRQIEKESDELENDLRPFLESESWLNQMTGTAMVVGALKVWLIQLRKLEAEEDSLITQLVSSTVGMTGDAAQHADEGVRLLREQQVYLKQGIDRAERLTKEMTELFRSVREDRLGELEEAFSEEKFAAELKALDELDQKQELVLARAKDAFLRLRATLR